MFFTENALNNITIADKVEKFMALSGLSLIDVGSGNSHKGGFVAFAPFPGLLSLRRLALNQTMADHQPLLL